MSATFDSTKTALSELLTRAHSGKLQLPDFQRGWVWDDDRIRGLLASISVSFPIGAVMLLETGGEHVRFKPRPLEGTPEGLGKISPETLILDGQQRLTSLYQALRGTEAASTKDSKGKPIRRWYYADMKKAIIDEDDREDAILGIPEDRRVKAFGGDIVIDVTTPEREFEADLFPVHRVFDSAGWRQQYNQHWGYSPEKIQLFDEFEREFIKRIEQYQVPVIELKKETPKEAVCLVFERVNTGGMALTVFELLTATFAADEFQLRDDWEVRERRLKTEHPVLRQLQSDDFLQAISLLVTREKRRTALEDGTPADKAPGISCKRKDLLKLEVSDWKTWADRVEKGFVRAARFLHGQKIFKARDVPYRTQLVPLAAILVALDKKGETEGARRRITKWFWCGVLGELYGSAIESRFARDLPEVVAYVEDGVEGSATIQEANFQARRLLTLRSRNSAAYKGIHALLMRDGSRDFRTGEPIEAQTFYDDKIDIHHIFPRKWCTDESIKRKTYNSIINKTAISARTNRQIGGKAPSRYLPVIEKHAEIDPVEMNEILGSHCIDPPTLRSDDFWCFFAARAGELLERIETAIGKPVTREPGLFASDVKVDDEQDEPEDWEDEELADADEDLLPAAAS